MKRGKRRDGPMASLYREAINVCACPFHTGAPSIVLETHHIVPISKGGKEKDFNNFICLCHRCHRNNDLHSRFREMLPDVLHWKMFSELLVLETTSNSCDNLTFRRALFDAAKKMNTPGGYEYRIRHFYEMNEKMTDPHPLSLDEMLEHDNGHTDARIDAMHRNVAATMRAEKREEMARIRSIPIYLMRTKNGGKV